MNEDYKKLIDGIWKKLGMNPIGSLSREEWNTIANNIELRIYFLSRIKKHIPIDFDSLEEEDIWKLLFSEEYLLDFMEIIKRNNPEFYAEFWAEIGEIISTNKDQADELYGEGFSERCMNYYNKNKKDIFEKMLDYPDAVRDKYNDEDIVDTIIKYDKVEALKKVPTITNPSTDLENFIIKNIDKIDFYIDIYSERIADAFIKEGKQIFLSKFFDRRPEIETAILDAIGNSSIEYTSVPKEFLNKWKDDTRVLIFFLSSDKFSDANYDYNIDYTNYLDNPTILKNIVQLIKSKNNFGHLFENSMFEYPELFEAIMLTSSTNTYYLNVHSDSFETLLATHPNSTIDTLIQFYNKYPIKGNELLEQIMPYYDKYNKDLDRLLERIITSYTFENYIEFINHQYRYPEPYPTFYEKCKEYISYTVDYIPDNFNFKKKYDDSIILTVIPLLNENQLSSKVLLEHYYDTAEKYEALVQRAAELKSDNINDIIEKYCYKYISENIINIYFREDNPLNLSLQQLSKIDYRRVKVLSVEQIEKYLVNSNPIDEAALQIIKNMIFAQPIINNVRVISELNDRQIKLLDLLFSTGSLSKMKDEHLYLFINTIFENAKFTNPDLENIIKSKFKKLLLSKENVPIDTSLFFDRELREKATYSPNLLLEDPDVMLNYPSDFYEYIEKSISEGLKINLALLILYAGKTNKPEALNYNNYFYDEDTISEIITNNFLFSSIVKFALNNENAEKKLREILMSMDIDDINIKCSLNFNNNEYELVEKYLIEKINSIDADKLFISAFESNLFLGSNIIKCMLDKSPKFVEKYISYIIHNDLSPNLFKLDNFINSIEQVYSIPKENIIELSKLYGNNVIKLLETPSILELLRKDIGTIKKFVEIFKKRNLDVTTLMAINSSLQQTIYTKTNPEDIDLYTNMMAAIQRGITEDEISLFISILCKKNTYMGKEMNFEDSELDELYKTNKQRFLRVLIEKIKQNQNIYGPVLNQITSNYIKERRSEVENSLDIYKDTNIGFRYKKIQQLHNAIFEYLLEKEPNKILSFLSKIGITDLDKNTLVLLRYKDPKMFDENDLLLIKKNIPVLKKKLTPLFETISPNKIDSKFLERVEKEPDIPERIISQDDNSKINFEIFYKIIEDENVYNALIQTLNKLKFLDWGEIFNKTIDNLSIGESNPNEYNFINAFYTIYHLEMKEQQKQREEIIKEEIKLMKAAGKTDDEIKKYIAYKENEPLKITFSAYKILKYSVMFSSMSNCYKVIFGLEDYDLIKRNPGPNSAYKGTQQQRLDYNVNLYLEMMEKDEVTIPSFIKVHEYEDKEKRPLQVIVGCKADSRNLTHGERTGACMRAYGHANDLFEFTNTDPRGFHITFVDPVTGEYISRVSGFRNGNTVCFNQLRCSVNQELYTDKDIVEACMDIAQELIELSKDSEMPIENVICSPTYALEYAETQTIRGDYIGDGVYSGYKDVSNNAVVMATIGENGQNVPVKANGTNQPKYKCCRLPARIYKKEEINEDIKILIQRVNAIKDCLEHKELKDYYMSIDFDEDILTSRFEYAIIGQDYYVALQTNGTIISNCIFEKEEALNEYNNAIEMVEQYKKDIIGMGGLAC